MKISDMFRKRATIILLYRY